MSTLKVGTIQDHANSITAISIDSSVYQLSRLAVKIDWPFVVVINISSFVICFAATLYPAWQSSNLTPVEALRYE